VNGGDDIGEEDELRLVVRAGQLASLEGVDRRAKDQNKWVS